jgi:hypothetical protein
MSEEEHKKIEEVIQKVHEKEQAQFWRKIVTGILIGAVPLFVITALGSYMGNQIDTKVNKEKIENNTKSINQNCSRIRNIEESDQKQWQYIGTYFSSRNKTRGGMLNDTTKEY